ncbi:MAG: cytochrome c [Nitrospirae bacterium]|nr:cytochrome c [Nitrospirota bacterium]MBI3605381.1 cytochrome c [Nitrospirota bacterium]
MKLVKIVLGGMLVAALAVPAAFAAEKDITKSRVPAGDLEKAKAAKSPVDLNAADVIARGKAIFAGKGACFSCHGDTGKGDGIAAAGMEPAPRNFTNAQFNKLRTPGEMMWVLKNGSPNTPMIAVIPAQITEAEGWDVIAYERSLGGK